MSKISNYKNMKGKGLQTLNCKTSLMVSYDDLLQ